MRLLFICVTLLTAFVSALPTITERSPSPTGDGRGATIWIEPNFKGNAGAIPPNAWCNNLNDVFFDMDGKTRSMIVEKGMKCAFYIEYGCPTNGYKYEVGSKDVMLGARSLPDFLDEKIHSVYCAAI